MTEPPDDPLRAELKQLRDEFRQNTALFREAIRKLGAPRSDPAASERKLAAKRINERLKLLASALNALAIGVAGAALIIPGVSSPCIPLGASAARLVYYRSRPTFGGASRPPVYTERGLMMTWTLTLEVAGAALVLGVVGYHYAQHLARSFDQRYNRSDRGHTPAE